VNQEQEEALLANVKSLTDSMSLVDAIIRAEKLGQPKVMVFRCGHSGLFFPGDFLRGWGSLYGIGLGYSPVSEVLDSDYQTPPPAISPAIRNIDQIMHGLCVCNAQVDAVLVPEAEYFSNRAVLAIDDAQMDERVKIILPKQLAKSPTLKMLRANYASMNGGR